VREGPARPGRVSGDSHHGFDQGQRHGFFVPVEPVQGCALYGGVPGMRLSGRFQPARELAGGRCFQRGGAADDPEFTVQNQAGHDLGGPGDRPDDRAADDFDSFPVLEF
jgi:hypothetical protein